MVNSHKFWVMVGGGDSLYHITRGRRAVAQPFTLIRYHLPTPQQTTDIDSPWLSWSYSILICSLWCIIIYQRASYHHISLYNVYHQPRVCAILIKTIISSPVRIFPASSPFSVIHWRVEGKFLSSRSAFDYISNYQRAGQRSVLIEFLPFGPHQI